MEGWARSPSMEPTRVGFSSQPAAQPYVPQGAEQAMLNLKVEKLQATIAQQQIEILTAHLKEQATQIQQVSDQVEMSKPARRMVASDQ
jgi:hypothetical protein